MTDAPETPKAPAQIAAIVEALGVEDAVEFVLNFGGAELHISKDPRRENLVTQKFGLQKAQALGKVADRIPSRIPIPKRWLAQYFSAKGLTQAQIARKLHTTDVTVGRYLGTRKQPDPQQTSFLDFFPRDS